MSSGSGVKGAGRVYGGGDRDSLYDVDKGSKWRSEGGLLTAAATVRGQATRVRVTEK